MNIVEIIVLLITVIIIICILRQNKAIKKERRIGNYSIYPMKENTPSIVDKITGKYYSMVTKLRKYVSKINIYKKASLRYEKYIVYNEKDLVRPIDYIIHKLFISFIFLLIAIFSQLLQERGISLFQIVFYLVLGYYILDIYLIIDRKRKIKKIENEMLRAIMIMNNAFKSGKTTLQAVKIASQELSEPINHEFERIYHDLTFGLSVDAVFERFAKRIDIEEARYLSSSLTILNRTGGNIVKVFSSIERTLFDKKKMDEELNKLTVSSKMIVKVLLVVPFIFIAIIYLLNPSYFNPFFSSPLGYFLLFIIVIMFIMYIWILQRIMKVGDR